MVTKISFISVQHMWQRDAVKPPELSGPTEHVFSLATASLQRLWTHFPHLSTCCSRGSDNMMKERGGVLAMICSYVQGGTVETWPVHLSASVT